MTVESLGTKAADMAILGAIAYFQAQRVDARPYIAQLSAALKPLVKAALPQAMADAREAIDCGMREIASATFAASMRIAGIAAAKDVLEANGKLFR